MNPVEYATTLMEPYEPQVPIHELVEQLNRFYHAQESQYYDRQHPEIHHQLTPLWSEMIRCGLTGPADKPLRVLDVGCGTGFEADQLLKNLPETRIAQLVCYDLSPEMLDVCRERLKRHRHSIEFTADLSEVSTAEGKFDVLMTNALLHHLPDPLGMVRQLSGMLADGAVWLAGHEPSSRYYRNRSCCEVLDRFRRERRFRRYFMPGKYVVKFKQLLRNNHPAKYAAKLAVQKGLVRHKPAAVAVSHLVDLHVAHTQQEAAAGRGFDFRELEETLSDEWTLAWHKTYSYMGTFFEGDISAKWLPVCRRLERDFPDDGHNFCAVWQRRRAA